MDLEKNVFTKNNPKEIALSVFSSAKKSTRKKSTSYKSAMAMITFYINRAGIKLSEKRKIILEKAKEYLRKHREKLEKL
jgi:hypothetical protein